MGCVKSSSNSNEDAANRVRKPRPWTHEDPRPISLDELREVRNVFWRNVPRFGGNPEIWQALRRAAQSDLPYAQAIIDENNITLENPDLTACYDETGYRYELPLYVLSEPSNLRGNTTTAGPSNRPSMMERLRRRT